jgi:hypothetical protein
MDDKTDLLSRRSFDSLDNIDENLILSRSEKRSFFPQWLRLRVVLEILGVVLLFGFATLLGVESNRNSYHLSPGSDVRKVIPDGMYLQYSEKLARAYSLSIRRGWRCQNNSQAMDRNELANPRRSYHKQKRPP